MNIGDTKILKFVAWQIRSQECSFSLWKATMQDRSQREGLRIQEKSIYNQRFWITNKLLTNTESLRKLISPALSSRRINRPGKKAKWDSAQRNWSEQSGLGQFSVGPEWARWITATDATKENWTAQDSMGWTFRTIARHVFPMTALDKAGLGMWKE